MDPIFPAQGKFRPHISDHKLRVWGIIPSNVLPWIWCLAKIPINARVVFQNSSQCPASQSTPREYSLSLTRIYLTLLVESFSSLEVCSSGSLIRTKLTVAGTAGIGRTTILSLCKHGPRHIVFTGRNSDRADEVVNEARKISPRLPITFLQCDQSSLQSVEAVAKKFLANFNMLDIMFANAGVMALPPGLTRDGYEVQFGTNHMGHALLLKYLLPLMVTTASAGRDVRLITTSSSAFQGSFGIAYDTIKTTQSAFFGHFRRYMQSKLANTLYSQKIAELYPEIMSCSVQPGAVATDIGNGQLGWLGELMKAIGTGGRYLSPEEGAYNMCWVATTNRENLQNGAYYEPVGWLGTMTSISKDQTARDQLWEWTQEELEQYKL
jgi:NAD(P)-dependent dehydrogenase (short-subunit alcohol dehydrogenase family)